jgi:hypothetical protein
MRVLTHDVELIFITYSGSPLFILTSLFSFQSKVIGLLIRLSQCDKTLTATQTQSALIGSTWKSKSIYICLDINNKHTYRQTENNQIYIDLPDSYYYPWLLNELCCVFKITQTYEEETPSADFNFYNYRFFKDKMKK